MKKFFPLILLGTLLFTPALAFAQLVSCDGPDCDWGKLLQLAQNILNFIITIGIIWAAVQFAHAGVLFFTSGASSENLSKAKGIFYKVVIGLIIMLTAWLVVNTILETFTGRGLDERSQEVSAVPVDILHPIV